MEMTEVEICHRYTRNGCYHKHVRILAELNAVDDEVIREILIRNGVYRYTRTELDRMKAGVFA